VALDSLVPHQIVRCPSDFAALTSAWYCAALFTWQSRPLALASRCSAGTPDSPVAHRTVRWIIVERAMEFPRVAGLKLYDLVHRTLSGSTPDSPVRQSSTHSSPFALIKLSP
jgi:hypothetical protein